MRSSFDTSSANRNGSSSSSSSNNNNESSSRNGSSSSSGGNSHKSSALASIITRAARHGLKRLNTAGDLHRLADQDAQLPPNKVQRYKHRHPHLHRHQQQHHHNTTREPEFNNADPTPRGSLDSHSSRRHYRLKCREQQDTDNKDSRYLLTTDEDEADRIHFKHNLIKLAFDGEFTLPIDFGQMKADGRVLDVGCGTGDWCIDLAKDYPDIHVMGVDSATNMLPDHSTSVPPNCEFITLNVLSRLLRRHFARATFDCIHIRLMCLAFTYEEYKHVVNECWGLLKPEGYLILMEMDTLVCSTGPTTAKLNQDVMDAAESRGLKPRLAPNLGELIPVEAVNKSEKYRSLPIGLWGGRLGVLFREDLLNGLIHSREAVKAYNATTAAEAKPNDGSPTEVVSFETQLDTAQRELEEYHSYSNFHYAVAQKPAVSINKRTHIS